MKANTKISPDKMTPELALSMLKDGNKRFIQNTMARRDLSIEVANTAGGQTPFATVLHCIDSRVSAELVFDQGVGDLFSIRIAGNFVNEDILGSMEFASKLSTAKLILVLGHTACGAVKGACDHARMGNLTTLVNKIEPAVAAVAEPTDESKRNSGNIDFVNAVAEKNVHMTMADIRSRSEILDKMIEDGDILLVGGMYDVGTGEVTFFN